MDSSYPGEEEAIAQFRIKGIRGEFVGVEKDPLTGVDVKIVRPDDEEWPTCYPVDEHGRKI